MNIRRGGRCLALTGLVALVALATGCSDHDPIAFDGPLPIAPGPGFASGTVFVVSSEGTAENLAVLSMDINTGRLGMLTGSPLNSGIVIDDVETLASDLSRRRVFFGGSGGGALGVFDIDAMGRLIQVTGSPFPAERGTPSAIKTSPTGDMIYIGYHSESIISRYAVDGAGTLTLAQTISTAPASHVETMLQVGDVLYVGFLNNSQIVGYQLDSAGAFSVDGMLNPITVANVTTNVRPDYLNVIGDKLYCSLANDGSIDAFQIEMNGDLTRLAGAPYEFPGIGLYELIAVRPGGIHIAVGSELPPSVALYSVNGDGSLAPSGQPVSLHSGQGGPEGMAFSADGRFLYVCDHIGGGLYAFEITNDVLGFAPEARYELPGSQIDVLRLNINVTP